MEDDPDQQPDRVAMRGEMRRLMEALHRPPARRVSQRVHPARRRGDERRGRCHRARPARGHGTHAPVSRARPAARGPVARHRRRHRATPSRSMASAAIASWRACCNARPPTAAAQRADSLRDTAVAAARRSRERRSSARHLMTVSTLARSHPCRSSIRRHWRRRAACSSAARASCCRAPAVALLAGNHTLAAAAGCGRPEGRADPQHRARRRARGDRGVPGGCAEQPAAKARARSGADVPGPPQGTRRSAGQDG